MKYWIAESSCGQVADPGVSILNGSFPDRWASFLTSDILLPILGGYPGENGYPSVTANPRR